MITAVLLTYCAAAAASPASFPELELIAAVPIDGSDGLDLSGLAHRGRSLYAVSDKDDTRIFRLILAPDYTSCRLQSAIPITLPPDSDKCRWHWKSLAVAPDAR